MSAAIRTTLTMMMIALVASIAAAYYYPWPEPESSGERINQPLFEVFNEEFDSDELRGIEIVRFNDDRNDLQNIKLRRRGEKWILPSKGNFVATNIKRISDVGGSLADKKIREEMSDKQEDHIKFGVVDPAQYGSAVRSSLGTKVILEGRQGKELASLIIGKPVKSDSQVPQRFVRIPDQPHVYVVDFDAGILSTQMEDWVDPNLLQLAATPHAVEIENYRIDPEKIAGGDRNWMYRARFASKNGQLDFDYLKIPTNEDDWESLDSLNQDQRMALASWVTVISQIPVSDARRKSKELIKLLRQPEDQWPAELNAELNSFGFHNRGLEDLRYRLDASGGEFSCVKDSGVRIAIYVGNFVSGEITTASGNLARYLMLTATVDESRFPEPEKVSDAETDRAYLRAVAERKKNLDSAQQIARELNKIYADWFYVVDEDVIDKLIPAISIDRSNQESDESTDAQPTADEETSQNL